MITKRGRVVSLYQAWDSAGSQPATGLGAGLSCRLYIYDWDTMDFSHVSTYTLAAGISEVGSTGVYFVDLSSGVTTNDLFFAQWECTAANCEDAEVDKLPAENFNISDIGGLIQAGL